MKLEEKRELAWKLYNDTPYPDKVSHLWKYSDPRWFEIDTNKKDSLISTKKTQIAFTIDSEFVSKGVILTELNSKTLSSNTLNNIIAKNIGSLTTKYPSKLTYLNDALWSSGYLLYVPKGVTVNKPIISRLSIKDKAEVLRVLIVMEEDSSLSLIEKLTSDDDDLHSVNIAAEVFLSNNAKLNYLTLQTYNKHITHHIFQRALLQSNAELTNLIVSLGGKITKADLGTILEGQKSKSSTYGIVLGDGVQKFDHHTTIEHLAPHTKSELDFRVALKDKSRSAYTGNLKITHDAIKSSAHQENRNLLLSNDAKAESIPELEILTNDVINCNHGVTVGQVDKEQIYYLMCRGLSQKEAERIIIEGFLEPTISRIPDESQKEEIQKKIDLKLETL